MKRTDKFKQLLEDKRKHITVGINKENGEPYLLYRIPNDGGVLHQSLGGGSACYALFISESGEIEDVLPVLGKDFKAAARFSLENVHPSEIDRTMSNIDEVLTILAGEKAEVI